MKILITLLTAIFLCGCNTHRTREIVHTKMADGWMGSKPVTFVYTYYDDKPPTIEAIPRTPVIGERPPGNAPLP